MYLKEEIIKEMVTHQEELVASLTSMRDGYRQSADLDEEDTMDPEDFSHQGEWFQAAHELDERIQHAQSDLEAIEKISTETMDHIAPHALVKTPELNFIIGIAFPQFHVNGEKYVGISTLAPIFQIMKGKKTGESFSFGKQVYRISEIL